ncbi:MAG: hypothetical protein ACOZF0_13300 [Thermodesulfobacteriota bacterium]
MPDKKNNRTLIWGVALTLAGLGVFFRIPQVMPRIAEIDYFSSVLGVIRFCFYLMGAILMVGGLRKVYAQLRRPDEQQKQ